MLMVPSNGTPLIFLAVSSEDAEFALPIRSPLTLNPGSKFIPVTKFPKPEIGVVPDIVYVASAITPCITSSILIKITGLSVLRVSLIFMLSNFVAPKPAIASGPTIYHPSL